MSPHVKALTDKIQTLSSRQIHEVEAFVDLLRDHEERSLVRASAAISEPALAAIWNNPEDDVYDAL